MEGQGGLRRELRRKEVLSNRISALHHLSTHHFHLPPYLADQAIYRYLHKIEKELNKARIDKEDEYLGAAAMMLVAKRSGRVVLAHDVAKAANLELKRLEDRARDFDPKYSALPTTDTTTLATIDDILADVKRMMESPTLTLKPSGVEEHDDFDVEREENRVQGAVLAQFGQMGEMRVRRRRDEKGELVEAEEEGEGDGEGGGRDGDVVDGGVTAPDGPSGSGRKRREAIRISAKQDPLRYQAVHGHLKRLYPLFPQIKQLSKDIHHMLASLNTMFGRNRIIVAIAIVVSALEGVGGMQITQVGLLFALLGVKEGKPASEGSVNTIHERYREIRNVIFDLAPHLREIGAQPGTIRIWNNSGIRTFPPKRVLLAALIKPVVENWKKLYDRRFRERKDGNKNHRAVFLDGKELWEKVMPGLKPPMIMSKKAIEARERMKRLAEARDVGAQGDGGDEAEEQEDAGLQDEHTESGSVIQLMAAPVNNTAPAVSEERSTLDLLDPEQFEEYQRQVEMDMVTAAKPPAQRKPRARKRVAEEGQGEDGDAAVPAKGRKTRKKKGDDTPGGTNESSSALGSRGDLSDSHTSVTGLQVPLLSPSASEAATSLRTISVEPTRASGQRAVNSDAEAMDVDEVTPPKKRARKHRKIADPVAREKARLKYFQDAADRLVFAIPAAPAVITSEDGTPQPEGQDSVGEKSGAASPSRYIDTYFHRDPQDREAVEDDKTSTWVLDRSMYSSRAVTPGRNTVLTRKKHVQDYLKSWRIENARTTRSSPSDSGDQQRADETDKQYARRLIKAVVLAKRPMRDIPLQIFPQSAVSARALLKGFDDIEDLPDDELFDEGELEGYMADEDLVTAREKQWKEEGSEEAWLRHCARNAEEEDEKVNRITNVNADSLALVHDRFSQFAEGDIEKATEHSFGVPGGDFEQEEDTDGEDQAGHLVDVDEAENIPM